VVTARGRDVDIPELNCAPVAFPTTLPMAFRRPFSLQGIELADRETVMRVISDVYASHVDDKFNSLKLSFTADHDASHPTGDRCYVLQFQGIVTTRFWLLNELAVRYPREMESLTVLMPNTWEADTTSVAADAVAIDSDLAHEDREADVTHAKDHTNPTSLLSLAVAVPMATAVNVASHAGLDDRRGPNIESYDQPTLVITLFCGAQ
jgi:hypothetical protein